MKKIPRLIIVFLGSLFLFSTKTNAQALGADADFNSKFAGNPVSFIIRLKASHTTDSVATTINPR